MQNVVSVLGPKVKRQLKPAAMPIVCFGMSSGGVGPLKTIFRSLSIHTGMAFVVLHHLRTAPTLLPAILSTCTDMPIELAEGGHLLRPNHVYVLPSGKEVKLADGFFSLHSRSKRTGFSNVLTVVLESLVRGSHPAVAVILSGMDADGAAALKAFSRGGGIVIVQAPATAECNDMPAAAILTGAVDHVLPPEAIPGQLERIARDFNESPNAEKNSLAGELP